MAHLAKQRNGLPSWGREAVAFVVPPVCARAVRGPRRLRSPQGDPEPSPSRGPDVTAYCAVPPRRARQFRVRLRSHVRLEVPAGFHHYPARSPAARGPGHASSLLPLHHRQYVVSYGPPEVLSRQRLGDVAQDWDRRSSDSAFSSQRPMSISPYIAAAVARCSCACTRFPVCW